MALKPCRECKNKISPRAETCPRCGEPDPIDEQDAGWGFILAAIVVAIAILGLAYLASTGALDLTAP